MKVLNLILITLLAVSQPVLAKEKTKKGKAVKPAEEVVYLICECQSVESAYNDDPLKPKPEFCNRNSEKISKKNGWSIKETSYVAEIEESSLDDKDKDVSITTKAFLNIDRLSGGYLREDSMVRKRVSTDKVIETYRIKERGQCKKVDGPSL